MKTIFITGISGVGKSTLIKQLASDLSLHHLQASEIIKAEFEAVGQKVPSSEELRRGNITENQILLASGYERIKHTLTGVVLLDAHIMIDTDSDMMMIQENIISRIDPSCIIFLYDDPSSIWKNRANDISRSRPIRSEAVLNEHQKKAIHYASIISVKMNIPMLIGSITQKEIIIKFVMGLI